MAARRGARRRRRRGVAGEGEGGEGGRPAIKEAAKGPGRLMKTPRQRELKNRMER